MRFKIFCAQRNFVVGDVAGNAARVVAAARAAAAQGGRVLLTPELALAGGDARDLFLRSAFLAACADAVRAVAEQTRDLADLTLVLCHPAAAASGAGLADCATVLRAGQVLARAERAWPCAPAAADALRYFAPQADATLARFEVDGVRLGVQVGAAQSAAPAAAVDLLLLAQARVFLEGADAVPAAAAALAQDWGVPLVSANLVGGLDECVYEGASFALAADGALAARAPAFEEALFAVEVAAAPAGVTVAGAVAPQEEADARLWRALVVGLRDYVHKSGFRTAALGLSGGIDSALVLALAVDALGPQQVRVLLMPSAYTADMSVQDAEAMAHRLGVQSDVVAIEPVFAAFKGALAPLFVGRSEDTTEENLQARIRGTLLMALSNKFGCMILETGNKSESAVGYATLYGDMCGSFAPIKDLFKGSVYRLARWRNAHDPYGRGASPIPERVITRAPSAELRSGQTDQDSLPAYEVLDAIAQRYVEEGASRAQLLAAGQAPEAVDRVLQLIHNSEYKRGQAVVGTITTKCGFGANWRYPIAGKFQA